MITVVFSFSVIYVTIINYIFFASNWTRCRYLDIIITMIYMGGANCEAEIITISQTSVDAFS